MRTDHERLLTGIAGPGARLYVAPGLGERLADLSARKAARPGALRQIGLALGAVTFGAIVVSCSKHDASRSEEKPTRPSSLKCLKVSRGPGAGRICMGAAYTVDGTASEDYFNAPEAWCITQRRAWTNPHSIMRCVPTEQECQRDLAVTPAGKQNLFLRTGCTRTEPSAWTAKEAPYSKPDGFNCELADASLLSKGPKKVEKCSVFPAELLNYDKKIISNAWCYDGDHPGMFNTHCYSNEDECIAEAAANKGKCEPREAATVIATEYGHLDKD